MSAERPSLTGVIVRLSLFTAMSLVLSTVVVASLLNLDTKPSHSYHAIFSDASDIQSGSPVRIAGVQVGQVTGVHLRGVNAAEVTFKLDSDQRITRSTDAAIQFENLFGARTLVLTAGGPAPPLLPGATIPESQTKPALDLSDLFNGFEPLFQALTPNDINQLTANIIGTFQGQSGSLAALVKEAGQLSNNLADHQQVIDQVVDNLTGLLRVVADHAGELGQLVDRFDTLSAQLAGERGQIGDAIQSADGLVSSLADVTGSVQAPLQSAIGSLGSVAGAITANQKQIDSAMGSLAPLFTHAAKVVQNGAFINVYYCSLAITIKTPVPLLPDPAQSAMDQFLASLGNPNVPYLAGVRSPSGQEGDPNAHTPECNP